MYKLSVDFKKCKDCWTCETLLPRFRSVYGGSLLISETKIDDEEIRAAAKRVQDACPNGAIKLQRVE
jgi:ferredoxin